MEKYRILLVGCGNLGSRYLQAASALKEVSEICVVDPSISSLDLGRKRLDELCVRNKNIKFYWNASINEAIEYADLCIISTLAKERPSIVKEIARSKKCKKFLIEKIVTQSTQEYEDLMKFSDKSNLSIWVNCQIRTYKIHKYIKSLLGPKEPLVLNNVGGNQGLACVGIHYADLFVFLDNAKEIKSSGEFIDPILHSNKRGENLYKLSGLLMAHSEKGSSLVIHYSKFELGPDYLFITTPRYKFAIDQNNSLTAFESSIFSNWEWKKVPIAEEYYLSKIGGKNIIDILKNNKCDLPTLKECFPAHKYILNTLLPHFNKLLKKNNNYCPVT